MDSPTWQIGVAPQEEEIDIKTQFECQHPVATAPGSVFVPLTLKFSSVCTQPQRVLLLYLNIPDQ